MPQDRDEEAWRAIIENYGERVELEDEPPLDVMEDDVATPEPQPDYDRYVPPPPPPLPVVPRDRMIAWLGLFGSPTVLLVALVLNIPLPPWLGYLLVAGFVGGFVYLVVKMPRGPADPWDDGARL